MFMGINVSGLSHMGINVSGHSHVGINVSGHSHVGINVSSHSRAPNALALSFRGDFLSKCQGTVRL
jgi:hypothetical protein